MSDPQEPNPFAEFFDPALQGLVGPILVGAAYPAHVLTPTVTARGVVNMTAVAVVEAQNR